LEVVVVALGTALAALAAFVIGGAYYALVPSTALQGGPSRSPLATVVVELARCAAVAGLVAGLLAAADIADPLGGAVLGLALWVVPVVLLAGAVFHEGTPARAALVHAGDWLLKLVAMGAIVGFFL
jgi:hypothetical protein